MLFCSLFPIEPWTGKTARLMTDELPYESIPAESRGSFQAQYLRNPPAMLGLVREENARPI